MNKHCLVAFVCVCGDASNTIPVAALETLVRDGYIKDSGNGYLVNQAGRYVLTPKGAAFLEALLKVPAPVQKWVVE